MIIYIIFIRILFIYYRDYFKMKFIINSKINQTNELFQRFNKFK